ncbi:MAG: MalY/PatB family protein [Campylobacterota bacterium]
MAKKIDFDTMIDRTSSNCVKYDASQERFGSENILPLWVADMDFAAPTKVQKALQQRTKHPVYGYTKYPNAYFDAIKSHMKSYGYRIKKEHILTVPSTVMAINIALQSFCQKGEGVIVQTPIYPPFLSSIKNNDLELLENRLRKDKRYEIDFEDFESKAQKARAFILCNPHNPTGRVFSKDEVKKLAQICIKHGVLIISDEIHSDIVYGKNKHHPIAKYAPKETITLNGPSKTYSLTGLSSAYAVIENSSLKRKMHHSLTCLGYHIANPFTIDATIAALGSNQYKKQLLSYLQSNKEYVQKQVNKIEQIECRMPEGTFLAWLDCSKLGLGDTQLKEFFVHKARLGLNSGIEFGQAGSGHMRLNFATPKKRLKKAFKQLKCAIKEKQ